MVMSCQHNVLNVLNTRNSSFVHDVFEGIEHD